MVKAIQSYSEYEDLVLSSDSAIVFITAPWSPRCEITLSDFEKSETKFPALKFFSVDYEQLSEVKVIAMVDPRRDRLPAMAFCKFGTTVHSTTEVTTVKILEEFLEKHRDGMI